LVNLDTCQVHQRSTEVHQIVQTLPVALPGGVVAEATTKRLARRVSRGRQPPLPLGASSTGGRKARCNGGLNLSALDGWWREGYQQENGRAIGAGEEYTKLPGQRAWARGAR
jgi:hypothetical protein